MSGSLRNMLRGTLSSMMGNTDLNIITKSPVGDDFADGAPECTYVKSSSKYTSFDRHIDSDYAYVNRKSLEVYSIDIPAAKKMNLVRKELELGGKKAAIPENFADEYGYKVGDTITLHGDNDVAVDFTVASIEKKQGVFTDESIIVIDLEDVKELSKGGNIEITSILVDVADDKEISKAEQFFKDKYPTANIINYLESEDVQKALDLLTRLFFVLFALCMLLVIFVTISVSERMIVDKMSVVGTFRSLGISSRKTTTALLFENGFFGLIGGILGILLYLLVKKPFFNSMFIGVEDAIKPEVPAPKAYLIFIVIAGAVLIECLCPIKETIKAIKTPIRDIIFNTKETEYRSSRIATIVGVLLLAAAAVTFFFNESFTLTMVCFVCIIAGVALLFNHVERFIAKLLAKLFEKLNFPIAHLGAVEAGAKKSTVGSSVLCVTAAALAIVIYIFSHSLSAINGRQIFNCDVINTIGGTKSDMLSYVDQLEGVEKTEFLYFTQDKVTFNDDKYDSIVYGWPDGGKELIEMFDGNFVNIGADEVCLDRLLLRKYKLKEGDTVDLTFMTEGYLPVKKTMKITGTVTTDYCCAAGNAVVINEDVYKEMYKDHPMYMFIKGDDPKGIKKTIQDHSADLIAQVMTTKEMNMQRAIANATLTAILNMLILIGVGLTFIGVVSNQLIGLEGRKRECAVMTSVAMPRSKLSKMFLIENMISAGTALLFAVPIGIAMSYVFMRLMDLLQQVMPIEVPWIRCIIYGIFLWGIFVLVSLFPIRALKKMDVVSQLKYE